MFLFKLRDTDISVDIGFLTVIAAISLTGGKISGYSFAACIIHEFGHLIEIYFSGNSVKNVAFNISGIKIVRRENRLASFGSDIAVLLAGPGANICAALIAFFISGSSDSEFIAVNIVLAAFNLLPFISLDGGSVMRLFIYSRFSVPTGNRVTGLIQFFNILLCLAGIAVWWFSRTGNISVPIMLIYLFMTELFVKHDTYI
jgi:Zn-dependent protease